MTGGRQDAPLRENDWVFARKWIESEPSHGSWGAEATSPTPPPVDMTVLVILGIGGGGIAIFVIIIIFLKRCPAGNGTPDAGCSW
ncbi:MAG: hypothetical protein EAX87_04920 [Candidatus Thorarchaeota archaeon]|nr:hypothetical protein [Candidatus Thorarchaeota archaeon]